MTDMTWRVRATVRRIIDGDTFVADMDLGWGVFRNEVTGAPSRVRLLNYSAPERDATSTAALAAMIPPGTTVWLESHKLDSFGRALCVVYLADGANLLDLLPSQWRST